MITIIYFYNYYYLSRRRTDLKRLVKVTSKTIIKCSLNNLCQSLKQSCARLRLYDSLLIKLSELF